MIDEHKKGVAAAIRVSDLACLSAAFLLLPTVAPLVEKLPILERIVSRPEGGLSIWSHDYLLLICFSIIIWWLVSLFCFTYRSRRATPLKVMILVYVRTLVIWSIATGCLAFFVRLDVLSRLALAIFFFLAGSLILAKEVILVVTLRYFRQRGYNTKGVLILGEELAAAKLKSLLDIKQHLGYVTTSLALTSQISDDGCDRLTVDENAFSRAEEVCILPGGSNREMEKLVSHLLKLGKRVHLVPVTFDASLFRWQLNDIAGLPVMTLGGVELEFAERTVKRALDMVLSAFGLLLFAPLMVLIGVLIKANSRGPVFFTQERLGKGGRLFKIYKFRTMRADAEDILRSDPALYREYVANNFKVPREKDNRTTGIGRLLRASSLDELPQLFNVLMGDMSLVGPRPIVPPEIEKYGDYRELYFSVRPGLTGPWQVNGRSTIEDYELRAKMDVEYLRDRSLPTDVSILLRTIPAVLGRKGAH